MEEPRRLLLAIVLSLAVVMLWSRFQGPAPAPGASPAAQATTPASPVPATATPAPDGLSGTAEAVTPAAPATRIADEREQRVEVSAADYAVAFTNKGARLVSWTLERYRDADGRPEEMVVATRSDLRPLDVETGDPIVDRQLREALFQPSSTALTVSDEAQPLRFRFSDGSLEAEKTILFRARGLVGITVSVKRDGRSLPTWLVWGPGVGNPSAAERSGQGFAELSVALSGGASRTFEPAKLPEGGQSLEGVRWAGVATNHFAALFVPPQTAAARVRASAVPAHGDEKPIPLPVTAVEVSGTAPVQLYVGAKDYEQLARLGHELQRVVQVGDWIGPIVVALMRLLRWVQNHVGNWGWSIVLLTVVINLVMAPFRHFSIANGMKMAKMAPEMRVIQERYRKVPLMDPRRQQMQEEMGALYAKHGMNMGSQMLVGCLPILLTMPFLIAFYRVLSVSVDLRGASFLWIPDLALKDPFYITPILMGVSMFAMQKMMPTAMDPAQQRMMMLMPLMLSFMFLWAPSGLNLYWFTSNLWSMAQQGLEMWWLRSAEGRSGRERRSR